MERKIKAMEKKYLLPALTWSKMFSQNGTAPKKEKPCGGWLKKYGLRNIIFRSWN